MYLKRRSTALALLKRVTVRWRSTYSKLLLNKKTKCVFQNDEISRNEFLRKEMLVVLLATATLASYADRYILNPGGHMFATFASYDLTIATSSDVINVLPSGLCEETPSIVPQEQSYIQSLIHEREALRTKRRCFKNSHTRLQRPSWQWMQSSRK